MIEIVEIGSDDLHWRFGGEGPVIPALRNWRVDPFPAYAHDREHVLRAAHICMAAYEPRSPITYYLSAYEDLGRTNGWANKSWNYADGAPDPKNPWNAEVFIAGKRIPPHPSVTAYVAAHEYGHHVQWWLEDEHSMDEDDLLKVYAEFRGLPHRTRAHGGAWHDSPGEVFACDFRIIMAEVEVEYWPHPGVPHPLEDRRVKDWWRFQVKQGNLGG